MAGPTDAQLKALVIATIGDDTKNTLAQLIDGIWLLHHKAASHPGLRYQLALRSAIEVMQGVVRNLVDTSRVGDRSVDLGDRFDHLATMHEQATAEINQLSAIIARRRRSGGAMRPIARVTPIAHPTLSAEDSALIDRRLRGDAYLDLAGGSQ